MFNKHVNFLYFIGRVSSKAAYRYLVSVLSFGLTSKYYFKPSFIKKKVIICSITTYKHTLQRLVVFFYGTNTPVVLKLMRIGSFLCVKRVFLDLHKKGLIFISKLDLLKGLGFSFYKLFGEIRYSREKTRKLSWPY